MKRQPDSLAIQPAHLEIIQDILQTHVPEHTVWAFGSRVRGTARQYSDLDLVVITRQPLSLDCLATLKEAFSESDLPWQVDVLDWATISATFGEHIKQRYIVIQHGRP